MLLLLCLAKKKIKPYGDRRHHGHGLVPTSRRVPFPIARQRFTVSGRKKKKCQFNATHKPLPGFHRPITRLRTCRTKRDIARAVSFWTDRNRRKNKKNTTKAVCAKFYAAISGKSSAANRLFGPYGQRIVAFLIERSHENSVRLVPIVRCRSVRSLFDSFPNSLRYSSGSLFTRPFSWPSSVNFEP